MPRIAVTIFDTTLEKFINSLETQTIAKVLRTIDLLEEFGSELGMPHSKKVTDRIFELRIHGAQNVRIFYAYIHGGAMLLSGFLKKSSKTPRREIETAKHKLHSLD